MNLFKIILQSSLKNFLEMTRYIVKTRVALIFILQNNNDWFEIGM
jgi:hypothetical protein